jgi:hypothetical protein
MLMMHELVVVESLLIGKAWKLDNRKLCESNACISWGGNKLLTTGIAYGSA